MDVDTVHYVSLLPHGTATSTFTSGSTMLQLRDRQVTDCGEAVARVLH